MAKNSNILLESGTNELEIVELLIQLPNRPRGEYQSFGINVAKVREIIRMPKLTIMPELPNSVYGIFNLRGHIIPALDLMHYLYQVKNESPDRKMIIAEFNKVMVGFIVSEVSRIHRISWSEIMAPDSISEYSEENTSISGIINFTDRHILMIDVEKIVADIDPRAAMENVEHIEKVEGKPKVLTAEDSHTISKLIVDKLTKAGYEVLSFKDGLEAWKYLETVAQKVAAGANLNDLLNVIVTDIEMPQMDGYSLTKKIKENDHLKKLPVIIFSSIISQDILHKGSSVGADVQLSKPKMSDLIDTVRKYI